MWTVSTLHQALFTRRKSLSCPSLRSMSSTNPAWIHSNSQALWASSTTDQKWWDPDAQLKRALDTLPIHDTKSQASTQTCMRSRTKTAFFRYCKASLTTPTISVATSLWRTPRLGAGTGPRSTGVLNAKQRDSQDKMQLIWSGARLNRPKRSTRCTILASRS